MTDEKGIGIFHFSSPIGAKLGFPVGYGWVDAGLDTPKSVGQGRASGEVPVGVPASPSLGVN